MVQLLNEALTFDQAQIEVLHEGKEGARKDLHMKGVFIQGGVKTVSYTHLRAHET